MLTGDPFQEGALARMADLRREADAARLVASARRSKPTVSLRSRVIAAIRVHRGAEPATAAAPRTAVSGAAICCA